MTQKIGERIKQAREAANLSQKELAGKLGVDGSNISLWESCRRRPPASQLKKLCAIFGWDEVDAELEVSEIITASPATKVTADNLETVMTIVKALGGTVTLGYLMQTIQQACHNNEKKEDEK